MVSSTIAPDQTHTFVIRPNRSLTWRQQKLFFCLMAVVVFGIAIGFASLGLWPVLPFAGLEMAVLGFALWACASAGLETEVVTVRGDHVAVMKGRKHLEPVWSAERGWALIQLQSAGESWYPSRLVMCSRGREVQLAAFLGEEEKGRLAVALRRAVELPGAGLSR